MSRLINRLRGRVYGWFDSKDAEVRQYGNLPNSRARLVLQNLEDRAVPATFTVLNTNDSGAGSLRQAMLDANASVGNDSIVFNTVAGIGKIDFSAGLNVVPLVTALPVLSATAGEFLTITGPGADKLVITRGISGALVRPFSLGGANEFTISDMTVTGFSGSSVGGAIFFNTSTTVASKLTLDRVNLSGNTTGSGFPGGALYLGSGIYNIRNSTISGNTSATTTGGGALRIVGTAAGSSITIENSTFTGNAVTGSGAGGGAISFTTFTGTATIRNTTITGNSTIGGTTATGTGGGGIQRGTTTAFTLTLESSIVAGNTAANNTDISLGGASNTFTTTNNVTGVVRLNTTDTGSATNPRVSVIGYHQGGVTPVVVPLRSAPASAAVDKQTTGTPPGGASDQTGTNRGALNYDAGSVESVAAPFAMIPVLASNPAAGGTSYTFSAFLYDNSGNGIDSTTLDDGDEFRVTGPGFNVLASYVAGSYNATTGEAKYTFTPPGGAWDGNDNGFYTVTLEANQIKTSLGTPIDAGFEGAFLVALPTPTAAVTGNNNLFTAGGTTHNFTITYTDVSGGAGINASTLGNNDVRVTGPNGFNQVATLVGTYSNATPLVVTYQITAPGGTWDATDAGIYTVAVESQSVANTAGTFVPTASVGTFTFAAPITYTVTNTDDSGAGSLRQAILDANTSLAADTIVFQAGLTGTIALASQIAITDAVTIDGPGPDVISISGNGVTRHFSITAPNTVDVLIKDLKLESGNGTTGGVSPTAGDGGSINVTVSKVTLDNVQLVSNSTTAANDGGAISVGATGILNVRNSTLSGNVAGTAAGADAGAIYFGTSGTLTIENSTLSGNSSNGRGGAVYFENATAGIGVLTVSNSTLVGNITSSAAGSGGGAIFVQGAVTTINIRNSTIIDNVADSTATTAGVGGGGIASLNAATIFNIESSIIARNTSANSRPDISSASNVTAKFSALGDAGGFTLSGTSGNNLAFGVDLKLPSAGAALADNGGPTLTVLPASNSPIVDKGSNPGGFTTDQRGAGTNSVSFPRTKITTDIGAVEVGFLTVPTATPTLTNVTNAQSGQTTYTFTVTYNDGTSKIKVTTLDNKDLRVTGPNGFDQLATFTGVDVNTDGTPRVATYQFTAPVNDLAGFDNSDNGTYTVSVETGEVTNIGNTPVDPGSIGTFTVSVGKIFTVTTNADSGAGSLRQAILDANTTTSPDVIVFNTDNDPGETNFTTPQTITLDTGELLISEDLTVTGPGAGLLTITSSAANRAFNINSGGTITVSLSKLRIANIAAGSTNGSAIQFNNEVLTLDSVVVANNTTTSGAAVTAATAGSVLNLLNSAIVNNKSGIGGGVSIASLTTGSTVVVRNSTISGNSSSGLGGGIYHSNTTAATNFSIFNSTITNNTSTGGGGIRATNTATIVTIESSIIAGNAGPGTSPDILNFTVNSKNSAIGNATGYTKGTSTDDVTIGAALNLLPLTETAGTFVIPIGAGPLVDAGLNTSGAAFDQRGTGFPREVPTGEPDIGAFERDPSVPNAAVGTLVNIVPANAAANNPYTFTVTYNVGTGTINGSTLDSNDIRITGPNGFNTLATFVGASPTGSAANIVATYQFNAPANPSTGWDFNDNGSYSVSLEPTQVSTTSGTPVSAGTLGSFSVAFPIIFTVTNTADSGPGSLRQAIEDANATTLADIIVFNADNDPGETNFTLPQTIALGSELAITNPITITGPGASLLTITGGSTRHFNTSTAPALAAIEIASLTLADANGTANGGSIFIGDEAITLRNARIVNNTTTAIGGAIFTDVSTNLTIIGSTLSGNVANSTSFGGGAMYLTGGGSGLTIQNSTLSGNKSSGSNGGGAIYTWTTVFPISISNSTFSGNSSAGSGGAIRINQAAATINILNSTIVDNTANTTGGGLSHSGTAATGVIVLDSTLVSRNSAAGAANDFLAAAGMTFKADFSAWTVNPAATVTGGNNVVAAPGVLGFSVLGDNGGPNQSVRLNGGLLVDAGRNTLALTTDGRGAGFARELPAGEPDIGAYELDPTIPIAGGGPFTNINNANAAANNPYVFTITYTSDSKINGGSLGNDDIRVTGPNSFNTLATFVSATPTGNATSVTATYQFTPPVNSAAGFDASDNGTYTIAVEDGKVSSEPGGLIFGGSIGTFFVGLAQTFVVMNADPSGADSLADVIDRANAVPGTLDTIQFLASVFNTPQTINLAADLEILDGVTIEGPGKGLLTLQGSSDRLFTINAIANAPVSIRDLKLTGGTITGNGGAVSVGDGDNVTFLRTEISGNTATALGGAIATLAGSSLTIQDSLVTGNSVTNAAGDGGAIHSASSTASTITIRNTTVSNNVAGDNGGGVSMLSGNLLIENSTLSGNTAGNGTTTGDGGGLYFTGTVGTGGVVVRNSTVSGNFANTTSTTTQASGGGLAFVALTGTAAVQNSTIVGNNSVSTSTTAGFGGGGIVQTGAGGFLEITSTIVSGNNSANTRPDISAASAVTLIRSAVGDPAGFTLSGSSGNNLAFGTDLKLGALADNGGPTLTHLPASDSPVIDRGLNPSGLTTDQRGAGTNLAFPRSKSVADIGAVEIGFNPFPFASAVANDVNTTAAKYFFTVTYETGSAIDGTTIDDNDVRITGPSGFDQQAFYDSGDKTNGSPRVITYYINVPGGGFTELDNGGPYTVQMQPNQVKNTPEGNFVPSGPLDTFNVAFPTLLKVSNTNDSGNGSLRQAILDANAQPGVDVITFSTLFNSPQTISLTTGELSIAEGVTITGPGAANVTITTGNAGRVFNTAAAPANSVITLSGMTLSGNSAATGGAIDISDEDVTLQSMVLDSNIGPTGGAIRVALADGSLSIFDSTISNNSAATAGGGIAILTTSPLLVERSTFHNNVVTTGNSGGAIRYVGAPGATGYVIRNSTFFANVSGFNGGALGFTNLAAGSVAVIESTTIVNNTANSTGNGGGIGLNAGAGTLLITNSIISDNVIGGSGTNGKDIFATAAVVNINTSAYSDTAGFTATGSGNLVGQDLKLATPAFNGGPTKTFLPASDSPVVNAGSTTSPLATDQRGLTRVVGSNVDIGAVEVQAAAPVFPAVSSIAINQGAAGGSTQRSRISSITVTFAAPLTAGNITTLQTTDVVKLINNETGGAGTVQVRTGGTGTTLDGTVTVTATPGSNTAVLTFAGAVPLAPSDPRGVDFGSLSDGRWRLEIDSTPGGTPEFVSNPSTPTQQIRRLFGDINGDGTVDGGTDSASFAIGNFQTVIGLPAGTTTAAFDFNNDGTIDGGTDFAEFGSRFGRTV